jgi:hypothetical protein
VIAATDFFTVEVWTAHGLVTYHVLFVVHHAGRAVHIAGITTNPNPASFRRTLDDAGVKVVQIAFQASNTW